MQLEVDRFLTNTRLLENLALIASVRQDISDLEELQVEQILIDPTKVPDFLNPDTGS